LWSTARIHLGLTSEEFWGLTPRLFALLGKAKQLEIQREEWAAGVICSTLAAMHGQRKSPFDFMPSMAGKKKPELTKPKQSWQEQLSLIKVLDARIRSSHGLESS
jgi:hypothetical protein